MKRADRENKGEMVRLRQLLSAILASSLLLSGCSALKIRSTSDSEAGPASVGIDDGQSTPASSPTGPPIPEGMHKTTVDLGSDCPVDFTLALGPNWVPEAGYDGYQLYRSETNAIITFNCFEDDETSAQVIVDEARKRMFSEAGSARLSESTGDLDGGKYWTFHGTLSSEDMRAVDDSETVIFGLVAGVSENGRLSKVAIDMLAEETDAQAQEQFAQILPTVRLGDETLTTPDLR